MITKKYFYRAIAGVISYLLPLASYLLISCSDFLYEDTDQVIYADKSHLNNDADTLWSIAGIINKMQVIADRTILLGEVRGDLVDITSNASADLRQLSMFNISSDNKYNVPRDYYAVINNCNYFLAHADTALRNNRNEYIFMKEYAAVKTFRAWTYLQLVINYGRVPLITEPILSTDDSHKDFKMCGLQEICEFFIHDIMPYADVETPSYGSIRNTVSKLFYFPVYVVLGDLYLWAGDYKAAAQSYYKYLRQRNGTNSAYPLTTNAVRFSNRDSRWMTKSDSWSYGCFNIETLTATSELITMIPGDSIPSEGNYSELRNLFNSTEANEYKASIVPSQGIVSLSAAQKYCQFTSGGEFIYAPDGLDNYLTGDLRLSAVYTNADNVSSLSVNGKKITNYSAISKYSTRNVHVYRRTMVYLRLAEALNRAGYPRFAFQILKRGVNNSVIESEVLPYYPTDEAWIRMFDFPNTSYVLETTAGLATENTMGLHSHGCGYTAYNESYVLPDDSTLTDAARLQYQIEKVEDLIIDEEALEFAFEGYRFYDLMRVALRRNDPSYLANRIYQRKGTDGESNMRALIQADLNDMNTWYLNWNEKIGLK